MSLIRHFTQIGGAFCEDHGRIESGIAGLSWLPVPEHGGVSVGDDAARAIMATVRRYRLPNVSHVAVSDAFLPLTFCAARGHYGTAAVQLYIMAGGSEAAVVAADYDPRAVRRRLAA